MYEKDTQNIIIIHIIIIIVTFIVILLIVIIIIVQKGVHAELHVYNEADSAALSPPQETIFPPQPFRSQRLSRTARRPERQCRLVRRRLPKRQALPAAAARESGPRKREALSATTRWLGSSS